MRGGTPDHCYDTTDPVGKKVHDLTLNTFMDDITKTTSFSAGATAEEIELQLNGNTESLTETIATVGWALNPGKTNHLLCLMGTGKMATTRGLRSSKKNSRGRR